ncbi:MAG: 30S ribosomal protein S17 [Limisphaerales bacterium]
MAETETKTAPEIKEARGIRKERLGRVLSNKMAKTVVVSVERRYAHPRYKKVVKSFSKFYAHDEKNEAKVGDVVLIHETRPLSKLKRWRLTQVLAKNMDAPKAG